MKLLFEDLNILSETKQAIKDLGIESATSIQELAIPLMIEGKDFIAQAQTGTGKTFAFAVPILEKINVKDRSTQSLVLCPTRELALQVYNEFIKLVKYNKDVTVSPIVGGESYDRQFKALKRKPHIIVGTPGRIIDHMERKTIDLSDLKVLTFDEADEMLKMGFQEDIERILRDTPSERQTVLFSATIPNEIKKIAKNYQRDSEIIKVENQHLTVDTVSQNYFVVQKRDKLKLVRRILDLDSINSAIVFANTKKEVDEITEELRTFGYHADSLHGDLKQSQRNAVTNSFRNKSLTILVATDVAARGLDISNVELVINYELPHENEVYVHRIGRTGRAGNTGKAYSIVTPRGEGKIRELESFTKSKIGVLEVPTKKKIRGKRVAKFIDEITEEALNNESNHETVINTLIGKGITYEQLLNTLINKVIPSDSEYEEIEFVAPREQREKNKDNKSSRTRTRNDSNYTMYKISLGRKDKINPNYLLELLSNIFDIRPKNVGDIKHFDKYTNFQISNRTVDILGANKKVKYRGKNVVIEAI
ncbi:DEAD/DEAH box helicase [Haploplasma axanthum]|uniref:DEAD-box ATP-dependent RNA helicase n=1 Tax=Haploplasma axanthum TaxID=29552 RepID=A0A449BDL4_HAPAX|nr:DEAD/DEAH box helicase [Haploplasma axanthum]VEU80522.1 DEAD-box ATP-dependent RNA helicase [Haploplasma axanthum]